MPKFKTCWTRDASENACVVVEAANENEAYDKAYDIIDSLPGVHWVPGDYAANLDCCEILDCVEIGDPDAPLGDQNAQADQHPAVAALLAALEGLLSHACIADAAPEDVDEEDKALERAGRAAVRKARGES